MASTASPARCSRRRAPDLGLGSRVLDDRLDDERRVVQHGRVAADVHVAVDGRAERSQIEWTLASALSQEPSERANTVTSPRVAATAASPHAMAPDPAIARRSDTVTASC